jgi:peptidoglycan/LPS O-acetylase OafA/YrhL
MASRIWLYYVAAAATFIAGVLHLTLVPNVIDRNIGTGMLFLIGGIAQIFWVIPTVRRWGKVWYYIGMAGTLVLIIIWVTTRIPDNPITGRGGSISNIGFTTELFQVIYIIISLIIVLKDRNVSRKRDVIKSVDE